MDNQAGVFDPAEWFRHMFTGKAAKACTPAELVESVTTPLITMTASALKKYRKRIDADAPDSLHKVYRGFGVYAIEFPTSVYIGSVGEGSYFGRRWKHHLNDKHSRLHVAIRSLHPETVKFHALFQCRCELHARFVEQAALAYLAEEHAEQILNITCADQRAGRGRTPHNERKRKAALAIRDGIIEQAESRARP